MLRTSEVQLYSYLSSTNSTAVISFNSLPNDKIMVLSKFKAFANDKINVIANLKFAFERVENIVGIGESAGYQNFLLFPQCY